MEQGIGDRVVGESSTAATVSQAAEASADFGCGALHAALEGIQLGHRLMMHHRVGVLASLVSCTVTVSVDMNIALKGKASRIQSLA